jgi:hypothetical protein
LNQKGEQNLKKFIILIPIAIVAVVLSAIILRIFILGGDNTKKLSLNIIEPGKSITKKQGESFSVKGKASPYGALEFILKNKSNQQATGWVNIVKKVDNAEGNFQQEIKLPADMVPGKYSLAVNLDKISRVIDVNISGTIVDKKSPGSPPYFVYDGNRVSENLKVKRGQELTIEVLDDDGDLTKVWNEVFKAVSKYTLILPTANVAGDSVTIDASDHAGNKSTINVLIGEASQLIQQDTKPPIFYVNGEPQTNNARIVLKVNTKPTIKIVDDNIIDKVENIVVGKPEIEYQYSYDGLKEGPKDIVATDKANNSGVLTIIKDTKPPRFSVKSPLLLKPDASSKVKFTDTYGLFKVAGIDVIGNDFELDILSDSLKFGETNFDAYDVAGNKTTLLVVKYAPPEVRLCSPFNVLTNKNSTPVCVKFKNGYGTKTIIVNGNSKPVVQDKEETIFDVRLQEGQNKLNVSAKDDTNTINLGTITAIMDTTPPEIVSVNGESVGEQIRIIKESSDLSNSVTIKDLSGVDKVTLNNNDIKVVESKGALEEITIPGKSLKAGLNEMVILDKAGNKVTKSIVFNITENSEKVMNEINQLIKERNYSKAENLVDSYEKKRPGPTANLYRGLINYGREQYDKAIEYLNKAYQFRERYDRGSANIEYNLLYLGLANYQLWRKNMNNRDLSYKALSYLGQLDKPDVNLRAPGTYEKAKNTINIIQEELKKRPQ